MPQQTGYPTIQSAGAALGGTIADQFPRFCRTLMKDPRIVSTPELLQIVTGEPHPLGNFSIVGNGADPATIEQAITPLTEIGTPSALICTGDAQPPLDSMLAEHGFTLAESMAAMALDLDRLNPVDLADGYSFIEVGPAQREPWARAFALGYGIPLQIAELFTPRAEFDTTGDAEVLHYAITRDADGEFVSTAILFLEGGFAGVYSVATLEHERGKGLGAYATAQPLVLAGVRGYRTGILQASAMGESVYKRLGFETHGHLPLFVRMPS